MSGIALAMSHRHSGIFTYEFIAKGREMIIVPVLLQRGMAQVTLLVHTVLCCNCWTGRLLWSTGSNTIMSTYIVGVYCNRELIGQGMCTSERHFSDECFYMIISLY